MRGGRHRDGLVSRIDAGLQAGGKDGGEAIGEFGTDGAAAIEERPLAGSVLAVHGAGDDIARGQLGIGVDRLHEAQARAVDQGRAFAAQGFGAQGRRVEAGIEGGGVELDEFGVLDHRAQTGRHGHGLALGSGRRGGQREEAARPAHGEDRGLGLDRFGAAVRCFRLRAGAVGVITKQGDSFPAVADVDVAGGADGADQRRHDRRAGAIALHPGDAVTRMRGLARQRPSLALALERRTQGCQRLDFRRRALGQGTRCLRVHQSGPRRDRVSRMQRGRIVFGERSGHPALRPARRRAFTQRGAGEQDDGMRGKPERCPQASNAGTADEDRVGHRP